MAPNCGAPERDQKWAVEGFGNIPKSDSKIAEQSLTSDRYLSTLNGADFFFKKVKI